MNRQKQIPNSIEWMRIYGDAYKWLRHNKKPTTESKLYFRFTEKEKENSKIEKNGNVKCWQTTQKMLKMVL